MFETIHGQLSMREPASCVLEAGGVGYLLHIPLSTYEALPGRTGGLDGSSGLRADSGMRAHPEIRLFVHLVVREDEWKLFGFATQSERASFRALLKVNGVGPVMALALLSGFGPGELAATVGQGDVKALTRVKGVGKKTAERIVVELRDLWKDHAGGAVPSRSSLHTGLEAERVAGPVGDAVRALEALGFEPAEAERRVTKHLASLDEAAAERIEVSALVRASLRG